LISILYFRLVLEGSNLIVSAAAMPFGKKEQQGG
jgi:hypothetical protein